MEQHRIAEGVKALFLTYMNMTWKQNQERLI